MTILEEQAHAGEFLAAEANGSRSREVVTIGIEGEIKAATVLGQALSAGATAAADAGNTGDGTMSAVTVGAGAEAGIYTVTFVEPDADLGTFTVEAPGGETIGTGVVGTEFSTGGLTFTISDGAADFIAGDIFRITVAAGNLEYGSLDLSATNGLEHAGAILYRAVDTTGASVKEVAVVRDAEVNGSVLVWPDGITENQKSAAIAELEQKGIVVR